MAAPPSLVPSDSYVPYARRRNTPAQLDALNQLFDTTPHPSRAQRQALADETGMELKSVTNWFQNKRQTSRKKSHPFIVNENHSRMHSAQSPMLHRHRRAKFPLDRSKISLDRIAALSERPGLTSQTNTPRAPLTPGKKNARHRNPSSPSELWTHMLSSPGVAPSSPAPEEVRLAVLSSRAGTLFPLEWACLRAKQKKWADEDSDGFDIQPAIESCQEVDQDREVPEIIGLEHYTGVLLCGKASGLNEKDSDTLRSRPSGTPQFEDMEAAITLLGFKTRS